MKKILIALLFAPALALLAPAGAFASSGHEVHLDKAPNKRTDQAALQNGARIFVNYCLNCHSASYMRYNRLADIGLSEAQIKDNLMFTAEKVGEPMRIGMQRDDAKVWFGAAPPDLTIIARARASEDASGPDWLYTYLRSFYRDENRPTGWNNTVFENVGMPHALWELQGIQVKDEHGKLTLATPGKLSPEKYDESVADLVAFLQYIAEPASESRKELGVYVLVFLGVLLIFAYFLKREFWKDIH